MTTKYVEQVFGQKGTPVFEGEMEANICWMDWQASDGSGVTVVFENNCVVDKAWGDAEEALLDKLRRWLHLD
jgi:hypothetical protein